MIKNYKKYSQDLKFIKKYLEDVKRTGGENVESIALLIMEKEGYIKPKYKRMPYKKTKVFEGYVLTNKGKRGLKVLNELKL